MNNSESGGQADKRRNKALIPIAMMFIVIGMMFVVLFIVSTGPHGGAGLGPLGRMWLIGTGIAFEIVGLLAAVRAVVAARKTERQ